MFLVVPLITTVIGWLCGSALIGLAAGLVLLSLLVWANMPPSLPRRRRRSRR